MGWPPCKLPPRDLTFPGISGIVLAYANDSHLHVVHGAINEYSCQGGQGVNSNNPEVKPRNELRGIPWLILLVVGGLAFFWFVYTLNSRKPA